LSRPDQNPLWGDGWADLRDRWVLDPGVTFLNHGSFGACPRPVLEAQGAWRVEMERRPVEFLDRRLLGLLDAARADAASFLGADSGDLVFVPNATSAVSTVLASVRLGPGDEILLTDHSYPAVRTAVARACELTGAVARVVAVPLPLPEPDTIVASVTAAITPSTRLAVVDQVTSPTAAIFPTAELVAACRDRDVFTLVDGAHAAGMLDLRLQSLGADVWTGNFHKWVCAPKGSAAMVIRPDRHDVVRPLVASHGSGEGLHREFDWTGTDDPSPYLSVPAAIAFMEALGWDRVRRHNHALVLFGRAAVQDAVGTAAQVPDGALGSMAVVALPEGAADTREHARALCARLFEEHGIEVPVHAWNGRGYLRLSAQVYNAPEDYRRLATVLPDLLRSTG
jgi:isopenicillin-N epimerase